MLQVASCAENLRRFQNVTQLIEFYGHTLKPLLIQSRQKPNGEWDYPRADVRPPL